MAKTIIIDNVTVNYEILDNQVMIIGAQWSIPSMDKLKEELLEMLKKEHPTITDNIIFKDVNFTEPVTFD